MTIQHAKSLVRLASVVMLLTAWGCNNQPHLSADDPSLKTNAVKNRPTAGGGPNSAAPNTAVPRNATGSAAGTSQ